MSSVIIAMVKSILTRLLSKHYFIQSNMSRMPGIRVMNSFLPLFRILTIYNAENFRGANSPRLLFRNITQAIIFSIVLFAYLVGNMSNAWLCYSLKFDLIKTAIPLPVLLCNTQILIIYVSVALINHTINSTIERLQEICEKRKYGVLKQSSWFGVMSV